MTGRRTLARSVEPSQGRAARRLTVLLPGLRIAARVPAWPHHTIIEESQLFPLAASRDIYATAVVAPHASPGRLYDDLRGSRNPLELPS